jgi:hypothetical protein
MLDRRVAGRENWGHPVENSFKVELVTPLGDLKRIHINQQRTRSLS